MLAHTGDSIEQIAAATGFCDRNHFSRAFKRYYQIPPAEYRRNVQLSQ